MRGRSLMHTNEGETINLKRTGNQTRAQRASICPRRPAAMITVRPAAASSECNESCQRWMEFLFQVTLLFPMAGQGISDTSTITTIQRRPTRGCVIKEHVP